MKLEPLETLGEPVEVTQKFIQMMAMLKNNKIVDLPVPDGLVDDDVSYKIKEPHDKRRAKIITIK